MDNNAPSGTCYVCGHRNPDVIEEHHIVPRRYGGADDSYNIVDLCPTCHSALERIYNDSFYEELGVEKQSKSDQRVPLGDSRTQIQTIRAIRGFIEENQGDSTIDGVPVDAVVGELSDSYSPDRVERHIDALLMSGDLYAVGNDPSEVRVI